MCQDCRAQGIKRKIDQFEEPREVQRGTRKRSEKTKGRKARWDEVKAAEKDFFYYFNAVESDKAMKRGDCMDRWHREALQESRDLYNSRYAQFIRDFGTPLN